MLCTICKENLNLSMFGKNKQTNDWYRHQCKLCRKKQASEYYKNNSIRILSRNKNWYRNNKDKYNARYKWYQTTTKYKIIHSGYNSRKRTTHDWSVDTKSLQDLCNKQKNKCAICNTNLTRNVKWQVELDHIIPISRWGTHIIDNVQRTCKTCNRKKNCY